MVSEMKDIMENSDEISEALSAPLEGFIDEDELLNELEELEMECLDG